VRVRKSSVSCGILTGKTFALNNAMTTSVAALPAISTPATVSSDSFAKSLGLDSFSFHDLVSIVNPLQHIPIVSTIYRAVTGDAIKPIERVAGDALYGGLWGFVSSVANVAYQEITGKDFGEQALAFLEGKGGAPSTSSSTATSPTALASTDTGAAANATSPSVPSNASTLVAYGPPKPLQASMTVSSPSSADEASDRALMSAMTAKGFDSELSQRALAAYNRSLAATPSDSIPAF
jgi:hypothetical protein